MDTNSAAGERVAARQFDSISFWTLWLTLCALFFSVLACRLVSLLCQIRVGDDKFVHARIWAKLDGTSELHSAQGGKALGDEL